MRKLIVLLIIFISSPSLLLMAAEKNKGDFGNLVCFVRFADENDDSDSFDHPFSYFEQIFNDETSGANSVYNYFKEASYNQLFWKSTFFPAAENGKIISYKAQSERQYYREKGSLTPDGYENDTEKMSREQALIKEIVTYLSENLPADVNIDMDDNGFVDNLCIIISGRSELGSKYLLWPHRSALQLQNVPLIHGKKVTEYLMVFDDANGWSSLSPVPLNTGVLCHEMSHTLGTYDLYHAQGSLNPVGVWDLMSDNLLVPQQMSAYTKYKYCKWIDEIPEISEPGTYTLNPVGGSSKENIAYKIKLTGSDEYFVLEYRKKEGTFDSGLPGSGLLIYRINPKASGNINYNGTTRFDEQYLFRPGGTTTADGDITKAHFSAESGRTGFGGNNSLKPFYTDGSLARFAIANVSECDATISFDLQEIVPQIYLVQPDINLPGTANSSTQIKVQSDVAWTISNLPAWLKADPMQGAAGTFNITITALSDNETANYRTGSFTFAGADDASINATANVSQSSNIIQPPYNLRAESTDGVIKLSWMAPKEGSPLLTEDFEDSSDMHGWTTQNADQKGWKWTQTDNIRKAYTGTGLAHMWEEMVDRHQDEWLISPSFANGKSLSFYSRSIAPGKTPRFPDYYCVEISEDGGNTWTPIWDLMKQGTAVNQYELVELDLSDYMSDNMKIAFHAYDTDQDGVSYWWSVDDVAIYPQPEHSIVEGYEIYRDGIKIGTSTETSFTDEYPNTDADNIYTVKATGTFGITPSSEAVTINPTGMKDQKYKDINVSVINHVLSIQTDGAISSVSVYSLTGIKVKQEQPQDNQCNISLQDLPSGVYVIQIIKADSNRLVTFKVYR